MTIIDLEIGDEIISRAVTDKNNWIDRMRARIYNWIMRGIIITKRTDR